MAALATVVPLHQKQNRIKADTAASVMPEPAKLYSLIVIALLLHGPASDSDADRCRQCAKPWPCSQACLACRLLDGL